MFVNEVEAVGVVNPPGVQVIVAVLLILVIAFPIKPTSGRFANVVPVVAEQAPADPRRFELRVTAGVVAASVDDPPITEML